jgi:hypothetical protein
MGGQGNGSEFSVFSGWRFGRAREWEGRGMEEESSRDCNLVAPD